MHVGIVQGGEELALGDARAFVEEDASDAAGDLGGDGGAAARSDVAAGVQKGFAATGARGLVGHGDFNDGLLIPEGVDAAGNAGRG